MTKQVVRTERPIENRRARESRFQEIRRFVWTPYVRWRFDAGVKGRQAWCYPIDRSEVRIAGADPVRLLLMGDGPAAGSGVLIHELGVAGYLARHLAERLGRGVEITIAATPGASARSVLADMSAIDLDAHDVTVLMLISTDAQRLTGVTGWNQDFEAIIRTLKDANPPFVVVTSAHGLDTDGSKISCIGRIVSEHARLLVAEAARICVELGVSAVSLDDAVGPEARKQSRWGRLIAHHIAGPLGVRSDPPGHAAER